MLEICIKFQIKKKHKIAIKAYRCFIKLDINILKSGGCKHGEGDFHNLEARA